MSNIAMQGSATKKSCVAFSVYWIREQSHTDMMTQGYIGVSGNVKQRFASHKGMESGTNAHLRHAIEKSHKKLLGNYSKGKKWYTNGERSVFCLPENKPDDFNFGRLTPWFSGKGE